MPVLVACVTVASVATGALSASGAVPRRALTTVNQPASLTVSVSPNPQIEVGNGVVGAPSSEFYAVVSVSGPSFAGMKVKVDSPDLQASCAGSVAFETLQGGSVSSPVTGTSLSVVLDRSGNANMTVSASECSIGVDQVDAAPVKAPHTSASTNFIVSPPEVFSPGIFGWPNPEVNPEIETSDGDVYAVFSVGFPPTDAGQTVTVSSAQLDSRCAGVRFEPSTGGAVAVDASSAQTTLDDDGNAVFVFEGSACAPGSSEVIVEEDASPYYTYSTTFSTTSEAPTITKFDPAKGKPGTSVTITGTNLLGASAVSFNGTSAVTTTDTATKITTKVPTGATSVTILTGVTVTSAKSFKVT